MKACHMNARRRQFHPLTGFQPGNKFDENVPKSYRDRGLSYLSTTRELTDFLPWQWARGARLTGQKVRSNDWFAPQSGAGLSGGLTQSGNSPFAPRSGANVLITGGYKPSGGLAG